MYHNCCLFLIFQKILTESVLQWADGVFLMYSITDRRSIDVIRHIRFQIEEARNAKPIPLAFMLVANKSDLVHQRRVPYREGMFYRVWSPSRFNTRTSSVKLYLLSSYLR